MNIPFTLSILLTLQLVASPDPPLEKEPPGLLDGFLESLFGEGKAKTASEGHTHAADANADLEMSFEDDPSSPKSKQPAQPKRIDLQDDFDEAVKLSQLEQRPLLVIAGADWCSWCRKLEKELEQADAEPILTSWIVVKIDVDAAPELAEEFEVSALPALRVLSADRRVAAKREGYMPLAELQTWLEEAAPQVDPSLTRVLYESTAPDEEQLAKLLEFLGNRSPSIRQSATRRLIDARAVSAKAVIALLGNGRLSQRLCALDILRSWGAPVAGLDPWEPDSILTRHLDDLNAWTESNPAPSSDSAEPAAEVPVDPEKIKDTVTRLLLEPESKRRLLLSELMSYGSAVIPELRVRLTSATDMSDSQRTQLRELLMLNLASGKTRGEQATLLTALASLNPDTHRQAAAKLLELVELADQALVDELAQDTDPLVRESAMPALQRLGLLQQPERLPKLLNDKSPSVRTAVLRELAENPEPKSIELLSQHAKRETDEDLLVYTAKTLGELLDEAGVEETLCSLAKNASWRVRAAALDAFGKRGEYRFDYSSAVVSDKVFETVLSAAEDTDPFVMKRATELLPKLMSAGNAESVVRFLAKRPKDIERFWAAVPEHEQHGIVLPLSNAALHFIESRDPAQVSSAVTLLTKLNPDALKPHLPNLLTSTATPIRLAALKGTVALMESIRDEQLAVWAVELTVNFEDTPREAWYPVPESFQTLPALPEAFAGSDSQSGEKVADDLEPSPIPADVVAVDDPFGSEPFGGKPYTGKLEPKSEDATPAANREESQTAAANHNKLLSSWLVDWHAQPDTAGEFANVSAIKRLVHELWMSTDAAEILKDPSSENHAEMVWLALANLACGYKDSAEQLAVPAFLSPLNAHPKSEMNTAPVAVQILPWLPAQMRFQCIQDHRLNWQDEFTDDDKALLKAMTVFENHEVASWLLSNVGAQELSPSQFANTAEFISRALRGQHDRNATLQLSIRGLRGDVPFKESIMQVVGTRAAVDWLIQQHAAELSPNQRALLLTMLHAFDYRLGSQSAVGRVTSAKKWDREVEVAAHIALAAEPRIAADRAVQWLEHPLREVRLVALDRLASASNQFLPKAWALGVRTTQDDTDDEIPPFFLSARAMPAELLNELMKDPDTDIGWQAYMLLIAGGKEDLDDWKEDELDEEQLLTIAAALAKSQRSDAAALEFYRRVDRSIESYQKQILIRLLSAIDNAEVKAMVRSIKKNSSYSAFPSPPF